MLQPDPTWLLIADISGYTRYLAAEVTIREMTGVELTRTPDEVTSLSLW